MQRNEPKVTYLSITPATKEYAKRYGARYSKEHGWHIVGHVPYELEEFVVRPPRVREYNITVACPQCGGQMRLVSSKSGNIFWGCMLYPRCRGMRSADSVSDIGDATPISASNSVKPMVHLDVTDIDTANLVKLAIFQLGSAHRVERWFVTPKDALGGIRPIDVMKSKSPAGIRLLFDLLSRIND